MIPSVAAFTSLFRRRLLLVGSHVQRYSCMGSSDSSSIPWLISTSSTKPYWHNLHKISRSDKHRLFNLDLHQSPTFQFHPHATAMAAAGSRLIGSSQGFLIYAFDNGDITAINALTGTRLDLPPAPYDFSRYYNRVLLSPSLDKAVLLHRGDSQVEFARVSSSTWTPLPITTDYDIHDCVFHKGRLFLVDTLGTVLVFDEEHFLDDPLLLDIQHTLPGYHEDCLADHHILVESPDGDDLYFLFHYASPHHQDTLAFEVAKLDENCHGTTKWKRVRGIGNLAMFVARHCAISVPAINFPVLDTNVIYFVDSDRLLNPKGNLTLHIGVYCLKSNVIRTLGAATRYNSILNHMSMWFQPRVL